MIFNQKRSWEYKRWPKWYIEGESTGGRIHHCGALPVPHFHFWGRHRFKYHTKPLHQATYSVAFHHPYTWFMGSGAILANQWIDRIDGWRWKSKRERVGWWWIGWGWVREIGELGGGKWTLSVWVRQSADMWENIYVPSSLSFASTLPTTVPFGEFSNRFILYSGELNIGSLSLELITSTIISAVDVSCGMPVSVTMAFKWICLIDS